MENELANNNNKVQISGKIISDLTFSHELYGEGFYEFVLEVPRLSDFKDKIPVTISERLINDDVQIRKNITIKGQFRSYNKIENERSKLMLTVFAREVLPYNPETDTDVDPNIVELKCRICKQPVFRTTPFNREICDLLIASNRAYNKSDYLPCIAWGRNARFCKGLNVGDKIFVSGRIQSREYQKKLNETETVEKTAYEISINKIFLTNELDDIKIKELVENADISKNDIQENNKILNA